MQIKHLLLRNFKDSYRPISILPVASKVFGKLICKQLPNHFDNIFWKFHCGFRNNFSVQHCFLLMTSKWKKEVDDNKAFDTILTDLSKAFDYTFCDLVIAKLHADGLPLTVLKMIQDYVLNQKRGTRIGFSYKTT